METKKNFCKDCGQNHIKKWIERLLDQFLPAQILPQKTQLYLEKIIEKTFFRLPLIKVKREFSLSEIPLRTAVFIKEAKKRGFNFQAFLGPFGYINYFLMEIGKNPPPKVMGGKSFLFEGLPRAEFLQKRISRIIDDKAKVKNLLKKGKFLVLDGKGFWFFEKKKALKWAINKLEFPLVVKPKSGSGSSHVTTDIRNKKELQSAINWAISYSPFFIIERFLPKSFVFRATVVDFEKVFCVK